MSARAGHLVLHPERCDRCGLCVPACKPRALRVGSGYVYVDADACTGCLECVAVCKNRAVEARSRTPIASRSGSGAKVVVGSRAEAKTLRKQAQAAEKSAGRLAAKSQVPDAQRFSVVDLAAFARTPHAEESGGPVPWSLIDAAAVLAVLLLTFVAKDAALNGTPIALMPAAGRVLARVVVLGVFHAITVGVLAFIAAKHGSRLVDAFGLGRTTTTWGHKLVSAAWVVAVLLATRAFSIAYGVAAKGIGFAPPARSEGDLARIFGAGWVGLALSVVLVVIVGPVVEELVFRGVLLSAFQGALQGRLPGAGWIATALSALVFATYHFTAWLFIPTFALGLALGWIVRSRGGLWPAIVLHALYNLVPIAAAFYSAT